ncbi:MAG: hypothetical protein JXQ73_21640, partial [Phycisphaerae bacterium]|nr:hypothetical protein [Phycisphaerae bacterium]
MRCITDRLSGAPTSKDVVSPGFTSNLALAVASDADSITPPAVQSYRTQRTNVLTGLAHSFAYDSVNRMKGSTLSTDPPTVITYGLDGVGNRTTVTGGDNPGTYTMDTNDPPSDALMNQYTTTPMDARTYDDNGNLTARTGTSPPAGTFAYDYRDRMIRFTEALTGRVHTYAYDCFG